MVQIPVSFEWEGKVYNGGLLEVRGAYDRLWHLMINNYYCGMLVLNVYGEFTFHTQKGGDYQSLSDYFAAVVIAWYE